jgi:hypothetical protein
MKVQPLPHQFHIRCKIQKYHVKMQFQQILESHKQSSEGRFCFLYSAQGAELHWNVMGGTCMLQAPLSISAFLMYWSFWAITPQVSPLFCDLLSLSGSLSVSSRWSLQAMHNFFCKRLLLLALVNHTVTIRSLTLPVPQACADGGQRLSRHSKLLPLDAALVVQRAGR